MLTEKIGKYRWTVCALLFFATTVNYLDRQVLSLLKLPLKRSLTGQIPTTQILHRYFNLFMLFLCFLLEEL